MARGCALIDSRLDTAKIGSNRRVDADRPRLRAVFGGRKTFLHNLDPGRVETFFVPQKLQATGRDGPRRDRLSLFLVYRVWSQSGRNLEPCRAT